MEKITKKTVLARSLLRPTAHHARAPTCAVFSQRRSLSRPSPLRPGACWRQHGSLLIRRSSASLVGTKPPRAVGRKTLAPIFSVSPPSPLLLCPMAAGEDQVARGRRAAGNGRSSPRRWLGFPFLPFLFLFFVPRGGG
jgi:hypothetical protein